MAILLYNFFFYIVLASRSSFLYSFNDWVDANAFFTVGKSLFNGKVIFRDIFEQKGSLLYFIYGIGYLLSNTTFYGVFILEVLFSTVFLYYVHKIISLYLDDKYSLWIIPIFAFLIYTTPTFQQGSSCEEFCLPFFIITIYCLLKYAKDRKINYKEIYLVGFLASLIFFMKYTLLGISFAFMLYIYLLIHCVKNDINN